MQVNFHTIGTSSGLLSDKTARISILNEPELDYTKEEKENTCIDQIQCEESNKRHNIYIS